jgi:hypothetical protein
MGRPSRILGASNRAELLVEEAQVALSSIEGGLVKALFKSSLVASVVFAAAWFRVPPTAAMIVRNFLFYGIASTVFSMVLGLSLARLIERLKIGRWWSYLTFAAATGALLGAILSSHPTVESPAARSLGSGEQETRIENPFSITFSHLRRYGGP